MCTKLTSIVCFKLILYRTVPKSDVSWIELINRNAIGADWHNTKRTKQMPVVSNDPCEVAQINITIKRV